MLGCLVVSVRFLGAGTPCYPWLGWRWAMVGVVMLGLIRGFLGVPSWSSVVGGLSMMRLV